ncbi:MAG: AI-2E family transporter [Calditrichia bacterium]
MRHHIPNYKKELRIIAAILSFLTIILVGWLLHQLQSIILPLIVAVFGIFIINPLINQILKIKNNKFVEILAIIFSLVLLFIILNGVGYLFFISIKKVAAGLPDYDAKFRLFMANISADQNFFSSFLDRLGVDTTEKWNWEKTLGDFSISSFIISVLGSIFNFISKTFLVVIYMLFILLGRGNLVPKLKKVLPPARLTSVQSTIENIEKRLQRYLITKTIISLVTGLLAGIVLFYFEVDFALTWVILTVFLNFIPTIGSFIATVLPVTIAFLSTGTLYPALPVLIFLMGIQFAIGNVIDPRIVGDVVDVSPVAVLVSLIFWGWLWGIMGMLLAVPIMVSIKLICESFPQLEFVSVLLSGKVQK